MMMALITNKHDERHGKTYPVFSTTKRFITILDGDKKVDYGQSEIRIVTGRRIK